MSLPLSLLFRHTTPQNAYFHNRSRYSTNSSSGKCVSCPASGTPQPNHSHAVASPPQTPAVENASVESSPLPPLRSRAFWLQASTWQRSAVNTLHCLLGCSVGDFAALFIFANYFPHVSMTVVMPVAMISGIASSTLLETLRLKYVLPALDWRGAVRTALNMSFLSMLTMEAAENMTNVLLARYFNEVSTLATATMHAPTGSSLASFLVMDMQHPYFAFSLVVSMLAGFLAPLPYNYYVVRRYNKRCH